GRLIPAGTGMASHEERRNRRTAALEAAFISKEEMVAAEEVEEVLSAEVIEGASPGNEAESQQDA
ncbi:MAG: hypothetical protein OEL79_10315, partial [Chromatiales bacterium]|nr:hypothetical protein [Chromatiales bacterium]